MGWVFSSSFFSETTGRTENPQGGRGVAVLKAHPLECLMFHRLFLPPTTQDSRLEAWRSGRLM